MNATITNVIKEHDRIRVFISSSDGVEEARIFPPDTTKSAVISSVKETLKEKKRTEENALDLAEKLINQVIEL